MGIGKTRPGVNVSVKPGQEDAVRIVWNEVYGMDGEPPKIIWVETPDLTCNDCQSFINPLSKERGHCVNGLFWPFATMIAWPAKARFSNTALSHELLHAYFYVTTRQVDQNHAKPEWTDPKGILYQATKRLKESGL